MEDELGRRGYSNPLWPHFGETPYNRRLTARLSDGERERASRWVSFLLLPTLPASAPAVDGSDWLRWLDGNERRYEPELRGLYIPTGPRRPVLGGAVCLKSASANGRVIAELLDT